MLSSEHILETAAAEGSIDPKEWPRTLETILSRLDNTFRNDFPIPSQPAPEPPPPPVSNADDDPTIEPLSQQSQETDKENAPPVTRSQTRPPVPPFASNHDVSSDDPADSSSTVTGEPPSMPQELTVLHQSIRNTLTRNFSTYPPHTVQRLAELTLHPKRHYRFLPSYLNALDRVISVQSNTSIFPLPLAELPSSTNTVLNGINTTAANQNHLGSDESLGGALLTPIPWLRTDRPASQAELKSEGSEMIDGPNGAGRIETVTVVNGVMTTTSVSPTASPTTSPTRGSVSTNPSSGTGNTAVTAGAGHESAIDNTAARTATEALLSRESGAVTQGELLRQEQEAGVVPVAHGSTSTRRALGPSLRSGTQNADTATGAGAEGAGLTSEAMEGMGMDVDSKTEATGAPSDSTDVKEEEHTPHARGPEEIGIEDMGPQALGSSISPPGSESSLAAAVGRMPVEPKVEEKMEGVEAAGVKQEERKEETKMKDDEDTEIVDADGKTEEERVKDEGEGKGADAVDTTTI